MRLKHPPPAHRQACLQGLREVGEGLWLGPIHTDSKLPRHRVKGEAGLAGDPKPLIVPPPPTGSHKTELRQERECHPALDGLNQDWAQRDADLAAQHNGARLFVQLRLNIGHRKVRARRRPRGLRGPGRRQHSLKNQQPVHDHEDHGKPWSTKPASQNKHGKSHHGPPPCRPASSRHSGTHDPATDIAGPVAIAPERPLPGPRPRREKQNM